MIVSYDDVDTFLSCQCQPRLVVMMVVAQVWQIPFSHGIVPRIFSSSHPHLVRKSQRDKYTVQMDKYKLILLLSVSSTVAKNNQKTSVRWRYFIYCILYVFTKACLFVCGENRKLSYDFLELYQNCM